MVEGGRRVVGERRWWGRGGGGGEEVGVECVRREGLTLFGDRPTRLPMNSTKQPNTAELLMKPVKTSPGWMEHKQRQQSHVSCPMTRLSVKEEPNNSRHSLNLSHVAL